MDIKTKAIFTELAHQRNQFADLVATLTGELADRDVRIAHLHQALDAISAPTEPTHEKKA